MIVTIKDKPCALCKGRGVVKTPKSPTPAPCPRCKGTGRTGYNTK